MGTATAMKEPTVSSGSAKQSNSTASSSNSNNSGPRSYSDDDFKINPKHAVNVVRAAEKTLAPDIAKNDRKPVEGVPTLTKEDVEIGRVIGVGGFGYVSQVKSCSAFKSRRQRLVIKTLVPHKNAESVLFGCHHIATEKHILAQLNHKHIISLRGCSEGGLRSIAQTARLDSCFILLDMLPETLSDRIAKWRQQEGGKTGGEAPKKKGPVRRLSRSISWSKIKTDDTAQQVYAKKLDIAIAIASGLQYTHEKRIILRDLKPDNVGFDKEGCVKLFDFGMAEQLPHGVDLETTHDLAGKVGTTRYMATEVLREEPYNVKADVFSFSLVLWEMLTLERPHGTAATPGAAVYGDRPKIPGSWPLALQRILERGWSDDLEERPCMMEFLFVLKDLRRMCAANDNDD